ncbi:AAA family ATPase [Streptomyces meridianus]|uniref:ATP-binding protein n=1 Tax=Streptomyces meridianus TaxID=2938945 RepID=A0ABT0X362_9ACTN|nr:ATP-binding protein [Streptomyces meridianus]MCM2576985.1 ATP-binding protein [Streptomyces meridianus]
MDATSPNTPGPVRVHRPCVTELRLSAYRSHRGAAFPLAPVTVFAGPSGSGKSGALEAFDSLVRLCGGDSLGDVFPDPSSCVPERARADAQGRRGFRIGCTVDGPEGAVQLDAAIQAEPELRIVGERLTAGGRTLLSTALRDPGRRTVQAAWHTAGSVPVTRVPLPDDRLGTALLPLRVAGRTDGEREVLAAVEQVVVALRSVFPCDPRPSSMRAPVPVGKGRLLRDCSNVADVLRRIREEFPMRHAALVSALGAGCAGRVDDIRVEDLADGSVRALLDRGPLGATPAGRLGSGELRYLGLALVLLTGPGVLSMEPAAEVLPARQALTLLADGFDRSLDARQVRELLAVAVRMGARGHVRLVGAAHDGSAAAAVDGVSVVDLRP